MCASRMTRRSWIKIWKNICNWSFYQREREKGTHTQRERERYRERERESVCMRASDRDIETELERERETERQRGRERKRERKRERERERGTKTTENSATAKKSFNESTNLTVFCSSILIKLWVAEVQFHQTPFDESSNEMYSLLQTIQRNLVTKKNYLFGLFDLHLHENFEMEEKALKLFNRFITTVKECKRFFSKCSINDPPIADDLLHLKFLLIGIDCVDVNFIGRVVLQSVQRLSKTLRVLRNNVFCHLANNICVFGVLPCASFWHFLNGAYFLERRITMCSEQVGNV